jgi:hypothetical protein
MLRTAVPRRSGGVRLTEQGELLLLSDSYDRSGPTWFPVREGSALMPASRRGSRPRELRDDFNLHTRVARQAGCLYG